MGNHLRARDASGPQRTSLTAARFAERRQWCGLKFVFFDSGSATFYGSRIVRLGAGLARLGTILSFRLIGASVGGQFSEEDENLRRDCGSPIISAIPVSSGAYAVSADGRLYQFYWNPAGAQASSEILIPTP